MSRRQAGKPAGGDLLGSPVSSLFWWCIPAAVGFLAQWLHLPEFVNALVWAVALGWMGTGCLINAIRCRRLHCYIAAPVFYLGATAEVLVAAGGIVIRHAANNVAGAAIALALLSFGAEMVWGRYVAR